MDLNKEQIDWLVEHFVHPGRAWIKLPSLEQSLIDLGLVKAETFPYADGFDVIVLSLTKSGWAAAIQYRSGDVKKHYDKFDNRFIREAEMANVSLGQLPEFLSSGDELVQDIAEIKLGKLLKEKKDKRDDWPGAI